MEKLTTLYNITNKSNVGNATNGTFYPEQSSLCLPSLTLDVIDDPSVYTSDIAVAICNIISGVFAFVANLVVIVTIVRTPALHRPVNVMLCSLAASDCVTGLVAQPVHAAWRFSLHHVTDLCKLTSLRQASKTAPFMMVGSTFVNLGVASIERLYAVYKPIVYSSKITLQGMVKTVVIMWIVWFTYVVAVETAVPDEVYRATENITMVLMIVVPIAAHALTFLIIRKNNRQIMTATHNSQQVLLFQREKKAFRLMAMYTIATLVSILPIFLLLNLEESVVKSHILFPWVNTVTYLVSSFNPIVQIWKNGNLRRAMRAVFISRQ